MFNSIGMPELIIVVVAISVPVILYRLGYNSGYRNALEKRLSKSPSETPVSGQRRIDLDD